MINLLPPEEKQKLLLEKKEKLTLIWLVVILVSFICFALILFSIKFYILADLDLQKNILSQSESVIKTQEFVNSNNIMQRYNGTLAQVDSFLKNETYFSQAFKIITGVPTPEGVRLTNFSLNRDKNGVMQINVSGTSDTRDNLINFKNNIEQIPQIKNPSFSPDSWISQKNANSSLTFSINGN